MTPLELTRLYFDLSNESDLEEIENLFTERTTYSSETTGIYLGASKIIEMQKSFHGKFKKLNWQINDIKEIKPSIVVVDFTFTGELLTGKTVSSSGVETVVVYNGKIQHIEIKSK